MSFRDDLPEPSPSPDENDPHENYALKAYDTLNLARGSEIYLQALERFIYQNVVVSWDIKNEMLNFLNLYRAEVNRGLDETAAILKAALERSWEDDE